ncbi:hypothetical protein FACS1894218_6410 [Bacilli bacterium]|nr:hypothetical protein FACS1894218_6410 [Bacilli bacterium]
MRNSIFFDDIQLNSADGTGTADLKVYRESERYYTADNDPISVSFALVPQNVTNATIDSVDANGETGVGTTSQITIVFGVAITDASFSTNDFTIQKTSAALGASADTVDVKIDRVARDTGNEDGTT